MLRQMLIDDAEHRRCEIVTFLVAAEPQDR